MAYTTEQIYRHVDSVGDGTGTKNMNVDGSVTPVVFQLLAEQPLEIERALIFIQDGVPWSTSGFGALGVLTNGVLVKLVRANGEELDFLDGETITSHIQWSHYCYDVAFYDSGGGDNYAVARWTWGKGGEPVCLDTGDSIQITIQDDLTELTEFSIFLHGHPMRGSFRKWGSGPHRAGGPR